MAVKKKTAKRVARAVHWPALTHCAPGVCDPRRTQGLRAPARQGTHTLVTLNGPGVFLSAHVTKQGGASGLTFVRLRIDGRGVVDLSYAAARNWGLIGANPTGLQLLGGGLIETFAIGWPTPLTFKKTLELSVVVNEPGVVQIVANVVTGSSP